MARSERATKPGDKPLNASARQLGTFAVISLVALRVGIGLHFFAEGAAKFQDPKPYSAGFLGNAKGRLAPLFRSMVWDADGLARLDLDNSLQIWDQYRERVVQHYELDEKQAARATEIKTQREGQLREWFNSNAPDIAEYRQGIQRRDKYRDDQQRTEVASLRAQLNRIEGELAAKRGELIGQIDQIWRGYESDLMALSGAGPGSWIDLPKPGRRLLDSESIDKIIRCFDATIGLLLIVGLLTRTASVLGAAFLCSVIASQWPGSPGAVPVWYQFIEMLGLIVLAATGAGRFAGLDFIIGSVRQWCCPPKRGAQS